jgi:O-antigen/teichoic acid export membrane protein
MNPSIRTNILANFAGRTWFALMGLAFVPLYIGYMGIESFGLVGFFITLAGATTILDMGLTTTLNRELARLSALPDAAAEIRTLLHTLEIVYWGIAMLTGAFVVVTAPLIADHWLQAETISNETVTRAVMMMGLTLALQLPMAFYGGGLLGLQKQVSYNIVYAGIATIRYAGVVLVLEFVSPTIIAFFTWQAGTVLVGVIVSRLVLINCLPRSSSARLFSAGILRKISGFAFGSAGITVTAVLLIQSDKLILSRILPLTDFGYYTLAWMVATVLFYITYPIYTAFFPRFSSVSVSDPSVLPLLYRKASQLMAIAIIPLGITLAFFSREILSLWVADVRTVENTWLLISVLVLGVIANGMLHIPNALQLSQGWTRLILICNSVAVFFLIPGMIFATMNWGAMGAAILWIALNVTFVCVIPLFMHRRLLAAEKPGWYTYSLAVPFLFTVVLCLIVKLISLKVEGYSIVFAVLGFLLSSALLIFVLPEIRKLVGELLRRFIAKGLESDAKGHYHSTGQEKKGTLSSGMKNQIKNFQDTLLSRKE